MVVLALESVFKLSHTLDPDEIVFFMMDTVFTINFPLSELVWPISDIPLASSGTFSDAVT